MNRNHLRLGLAGALTLLGILMLGAGRASAHTTITVGTYEVEVGWVDEPPIVGFKNAVFVSVTDTEAAKPVENLNTLDVEVTTGPASRKFALRPLGENGPGQYAADFIPTVRGSYTVRLTGTIGDQAIDEIVEIEEVGDINDLAFPEKIAGSAELAAQLDAAKAQANTAEIIAIVGAALGLVGAGLSVYGMTKK